MKDKNKIIIAVIGIIAVIAIATICIITGTNSKESSNDKNSVSTDELQHSTNDKDDIAEITESELNEIEEYMNSFDNVLIRKTVSRSVIQTEPEYSRDFTALEDIITEINTIKNSDITRTQDDYIDDNEDNLLDFEEYYGFDYKKYSNAYDVIVGLAEAQGINTDFTNSTFDEELYKGMEQKVYRLNEESDVIKDIISDLDYDEILESYCRFRVNENGPHSYISYISTTVKYMKDGEKISYIIHFQISIYNEGEEGTSCGCGCGSVSESECSDDDCALCELEESSE